MEDLEAKLLSAEDALALKTTESEAELKRLQVSHYSGGEG